MREKLPPLNLPWSVDDARAHHNYVISDSEGSIVALIPGTPNKAQPTNPPDDAEAKRRAHVIAAAVNAFGRVSAARTDKY